MRHTYITEQLKSSVPIYTIASNCNTSVAMIERYYSDARPKDFEDSLTEGYRKTSRMAVSKEKVVVSAKSAKVKTPPIKKAPPKRTRTSSKVVQTRQP